jgi:starvation-inducible outer membrane lipoprotein
MQWLSETGQIWCGRTILLLALCIAVGCSPVPRKYLREAGPNVTLTTLVDTPNLYQDKLVILGGVILRGGDAGRTVMVARKESTARSGLPAAASSQRG